MSIADKSYEQFKTDHAQDRLYSYPLHSRDVVFDVGGYKGQWTADLLDRCRIVCPQCEMKIDPIVHIFEPIPQFAEACRERFKDYPRVFIHEYGLTNWTRTRREDCEIVVDEAASCLYGPCPWRPNDPKPKQKVVLRDISEVLDALGIRFIELMSINIEGAEYDLLTHMLRTGIASRTHNIQVQFHEFIPEAEGKRNEIREQLKLTHKENFCYPFVWESWSLK